MIIPRLTLASLLESIYYEENSQLILMLRLTMDERKCSHGPLALLYLFIIIVFPRYDLCLAPRDTL